MKGFKFVEHIADIAIEVWGDSLSELFTAAFEGWENSVTSEIPEPNESKIINVEGETLEELLVSFLNEVNYFFLVKRWAAGDVESIDIIEENSRYLLKAKIYGGEIDFSKFVPKEEIKGVTYGGLKISKTKQHYSARIIFDV